MEVCSSNGWEVCSTEVLLHSSPTLKSTSPRMEPFHHGNNTASMVQSSVQGPHWTSWTLIEAEHRNYNLPFPLHHCRPAGEKKCCEFHHLSHTAQGGTSRTQNTPKQGDREQKHHMARSCQPAGPKIDVLPEVLIQASLSDISAFLLRVRRLHPCDIPVGCEGGRVKPHPTEGGRFRTLPKVGMPAL